MADKKPRLTLCSVQLRTEHGAQIADGDLHRVSRGALRLAADVVGRPGKDDGRCGVDAACGENRTNVRDSRTRVREQNDVANNCQAGTAHDERGSIVGFLRGHGDDDGEAGREYIRGHGEKLSFGG